MKKPFKAGDTVIFDKTSNYQGHGGKQAKVISISADKSYGSGFRVHAELVHTCQCKCGKVFRDELPALDADHFTKVKS